MLFCCHQIVKKILLLSGVGGTILYLLILVIQVTHQLLCGRGVVDSILIVGQV
jgi:hypothetical protein